jgi:hypothetical protein
MHLHSTNSHALTCGKQFEFFFFADCAGNESAGYDRAEALHGEDAVDGQARERCGIFRCNFGGDLGERGFQVVETRAR